MVNRTFPLLPVSTLAMFLIAGLGVALLLETPSRWLTPAQSIVRGASAAAETARVVYLAGELSSDEDMIMLTAAIAAADPSAVLLLDSPKARPHLKAFLTEFRPERVIPIGSFPNGIPDLEQRLGIRTAPLVEWKPGQPAALWKAILNRAARVVVCPARPRGLLLQAARLAGGCRAPLFILRNQDAERDMLGRQLADWGAHEVWAVGEAANVCRNFASIRLTALDSEEQIAAAAVQAQDKKGPVHALVLANAADTTKDKGKMSLLAPWLATQKGAALALTNEAGTNTATVVEAALHNPLLAQIDTLILVAGLEAVPMERRPNPARGKDESIQMEPLTPAGTEPFSFATGRLFHEDLGVLTLLLARQRLLASSALPGPRKALIVSNPGGGLSLMETFSRNTSMELRNRGYETTALFEGDATPDKVQRLMPDQDIFLWEGHYRTMVDEYGLPGWKEPLRPSLIFLQSCLALNEAEALPLFQRGAVSVVGTPTRNYSGSGGAFTLAFFDAMLYDDQSLGGALRQAKNFLLAYSLLKEKRLGSNARLGGANLRSAWAFTLWGDPTLKLPRPTPARDALPPVRSRVERNTIVLTLPEAVYPKVTTEGYQAQMWPNARLAGLLKKEPNQDERRLVPFLFAELALPQVPLDKTPRLKSKLPASRWQFCWDSRRRHGYLLVIPRARESEELRFQVSWETLTD